MTFQLLAAGLTTGLWAAVSPGPLLALLIDHGLRYGTAAAARVALAPLVTDVPIVAAALWAGASLAPWPGVLDGLSLAGGLYLGWLAAAGLRTATGDVEAVSGRQGRPNSLRQAVVVNLLNPHPYLFWFTVGGPLAVSALARGRTAAAAGFVGGFYLVMVGGKLLLAAGLGRWRQAMAAATVRRLGRITSACMLALAAVLVVRAVCGLAGAAGG